MSNKIRFSRAEREAIESLGGVEPCSRRANQILHDYGITRSFFTKQEVVDLKSSRTRRSKKIEIRFQFDPGRSLHANIQDLFDQALEVQKNAGGTAYLGAMLQHLVGAKLDLVLGKGNVAHHGFSVADQSTDRKGDFQADDVCLHITTMPTEALIRKCANNLRDGLKPLIVTVTEEVSGANFLLRAAGLQDRVDVLDATQFLTANVYERSFFQAANRKVTLGKLLSHYNEIVSECETDPSLRINMGKAEP